MDDDTFDKSYIYGIGKAIFLDLFLIIFGFSLYFLYYFTIENKLINVFNLILSPFFYWNNFIFLMILIVYLIYREKTRLI